MEITHKRAQGIAICKLATAISTLTAVRALLVIGMTGTPTAKQLAIAKSFRLFETFLRFTYYPQRGHRSEEPMYARIE